MDTSSFAGSIRAHTNPDSTNRRGAKRDAWLVRLAQIGPLWIEALLRLRLFPSRQSAERRLRKLEEAGQIRYAGRVSLRGFRRSHLWCNRLIPARLLKHELDIMQVFFAYWPHAFAVTGQDVDPNFRADMELTIGPIEAGRTYMVEIDEGTEPLSQVKQRLALYRTCPRTVLLVVPTQMRCEAVLRIQPSPRIYATTLERCLTDPWGTHWRNGLGQSGFVAPPAVKRGMAPEISSRD